MLHIYKPMVNKWTKSLKLKNNYLLKQIYTAINKDRLAIKIFLDKQLFHKALMCSTTPTDIVSLSLMATILGQDVHGAAWAHGRSLAPVKVTRLQLDERCLV